MIEARKEAVTASHKKRPRLRRAAPLAEPLISGDSVDGQYLRWLRHEDCEKERTESSLSIVEGAGTGTTGTTRDAAQVGGQER